MNIFNKKGFNFIEVIIAVVLIGLIVVSFSQLFSLSVDLPIVSDRSKALYYAQKEMEKLNNTPYDMISPLLRTNYPEDTNYDYEIKVKENSPQNNKKEVYVIFYFKEKPEILVDLYSEFIRMKPCEDFQDGNWNAPTWNWTRNPQGQWSLVQYPSGSGNYRAYYTRRQEGYIYPDWTGTSNYSVSLDFYVINYYPLANSFNIKLFGRYNNMTNSGYYLNVNTTLGGIIYDTVTTLSLYRIDSGNNQFLGESINYGLDLFDGWHNVKLEFLNNRIRVYLNNNLLFERQDNTYTSGSIRISVSGAKANPTYLDNICIKETTQP